MGSVVAFGVSEGIFLSVYGARLAGPQLASVWAFAGGIPVNYVLNRRWAWRVRGRPGLRDELLPYAGVVALSVIGSAVGTQAVDTWLQSVALHRVLEIAIVGATFATINGGLFLAKYVLLDRLVFRVRPSHLPAEQQRDAEPVP